MSKMVNQQVMGILVIIVGIILLPILSSSVNTAVSALTPSENYTAVASLLRILPLVFTVGLIIFGVYQFVQGMRNGNGAM